MNERDFVERLGDELTAAAGRQAAHGWRRRLPLPRRASGRALVLVGAVALVGAGGTAGLLAARGEVGGPPSLRFARISPQQRAAGVKPLTRPVIFARGRLSRDGSPWQLVGFQTTRGLCVEIDFPRQGRASGCGAPQPRGGRAIDWQAQIGLAGGTRRLVLGAVAPTVASVHLRQAAVRGLRGRSPRPKLLRGPRELRGSVQSRVIHVRDPRLLAAMGLRSEFAYWVAELDGPSGALRADAQGVDGGPVGQVEIPNGANDIATGVFFRSYVCRPRGAGANRPPRVVATLPPAAVRSRLAALRRLQRPEDMPPRWFMRSTLGMSYHATVEINAIRLLRRAPNGDGLYLVPTTDRLPFALPSPGCLRTLTPQQREHEALLERRAREQARRLHLTVYAVGQRSGGTAAVFDLDAYRHGHALYGLNGHRLIGMAPDGVARVEVRFAGGARRVVPVEGNAWIAPTPASSRRARAVIWLDGQGNVLRRLR
jgi:hypothetical protein